MEPKNIKIFSSGISADKDWRKAAADLCGKVKIELGAKSCDLLIFFVSEPYEGFDPKLFVDFISPLIPAAAMIGCNSSGVIGGDLEVEMEPAMSLMAMHLPEVKVTPFYLSPDQVDSAKSGTDLINLLDIYPTDRPHFITLADPASCDITSLLRAYNEGYKGLPVIGGLASGMVTGVPNWICLNQTVYAEGAVGVALTGNISFEVIVSQGCRPIDKPYVITKAVDNILYELAGRPSLEVVKEILEGLPEKDRKLAEQTLSAGLAMSEQKTSFKRGDFLIRNLMGFDPENGTLTIGETLKVGQTLQFQVRDAQTSDEDLKILLESMRDGAGESARGAVLVSCCGRGRTLYRKPNHDARLIQSVKGPLPLAGFFANGEIGPVGNKNYVHGYTSSLVILK